MSGSPPELPDRAALSSWLGERLGIAVGPEELEPEWRDERWIATLPQHVVWIGASEAGWAKLCREAAVLRRAREAAGAVIPALLLDDESARVQVRERMYGTHGHDIESSIFGMPASQLGLVDRFAPDCPLTPWGETFARELGGLLARLHGAMPARFGREIGLGPLVVRFDRIDRVLHDHVRVEVLTRALPQVRAWFESMQRDDVVLHGDPHFYNMFASDDGRLTGLIDFADAIVGDRHFDLQYLHSEGPRFARRAIDAYADASGAAVDERIAARFHVWAAFQHFDFVDPTAERFARIVAWATAALAALAPEWAH